MGEEAVLRRVGLVTRILKANDRIAAANRERFAQAGVCVIDIIGSPGAGKTALLEATLPRLAGRLRAGVVVGDIATTRDAERLAACGVPAVQITTESFGGTCHLEAGTVATALDQLEVGALDLLFVENVGNLVCPAEFDLGQHARVVVLSVTEGEDKPLKYPVAFQTTDLALISKTDLVPHLGCDLSLLRDNLRLVNPAGQYLELSARTGDGIDAWVSWLCDRVASARGAAVHSS
jgi:hydrogenase nickel incorporation protein HypB